MSLLKNNIIEHDVEVKNLSAWYENSLHEKKVVFENLNFCLNKNSLTALCGKNGSGKSTLLSLLDGIIPDGLKVSGEVLIGSKNVFIMKRKQIAEKVSFLVQKENPIWNMSVFDFVETGLYSFSLSKTERDFLINDALVKLNIEDFSQKKIFNISGGEFQKCRLARCLVQKSKILLLDEPSENLDLPYQTKFLKQIKDFSTEQTVLFSVHDINMASMFADNFLLFCGGQIIAGTKEKIFTEQVLEKAFNSKVKIYSHPQNSCPQVYFCD